MVNTMVTNPELRTINRKLDRQKRARMRLNEKALVDSSDSSFDSLTKIHTLKITELKKERDRLKAKHGEVKPEETGSDSDA